MGALLDVKLDPWNAFAVLLKVVAICIVVQLLRGIWWLFNLFVVAPPFDPLRHLPGPDAPRLKNHFREVMDPEITPDTHEQWVAQFGKTFRYHGFGAVGDIPCQTRSSN